MPIHTESAVAVPVASAGAKASKSNIVTYRLTWRDQLPINPPAYDLADDYVRRPSAKTARLSAPLHVQSTKVSVRDLIRDLRFQIHGFRSTVSDPRCQDSLLTADVVDVFLEMDTLAASTKTRCMNAVSRGPTG